MFALTAQVSPPKLRSTSRISPPQRPSKTHPRAHAAHDRPFLRRRNSFWERERERRERVSTPSFSPFRPSSGLGRLGGPPNPAGDGPFAHLHARMPPTYDRPFLRRRNSFWGRERGESGLAPPPFPPSDLHTSRGTERIEFDQLVVFPPSRSGFPFSLRGEQLALVSPVARLSHRLTARLALERVEALRAAVGRESSRPPPPHPHHHGVELLSLSLVFVATSVLLPLTSRSISFSPPLNYSGFVD